ncbi:alpha/beta hydrolase [Chloroflexota bacterium]
MKEDSVMFPCGELALEGYLHPPSGNGPFPAVVVCHPHPMFGGDMSNNVVMEVCAGLVRKGIAAFRFNFRGVGRSQGRYGQGVEEQKDAAAALDLVASNPAVESDRLGLAGYSFGSNVAFSVAIKNGRVGALALISPWLKDHEWNQLRDWPRPRFLIWGGRDEFVLKNMREVAENLSTSSSYEVVTGTDHFWWGYEGRMAESVAAFFAVNL